MQDNKADSKVSLKRSISMPLMVFYGLGTILGAGFYALVGKVAAESALYTPLAFIIAAVVAFFTAISYAELSSRFPVSAGEAFYVKKAFHKKWLSSLIGWLTILTGIVSTGAIANGFAGYLQVFIPIPEWFGIFVMIGAVGLVAIWGITESAILATVITLIEIGGMILVVILAGEHLEKLPAVLPDMVPDLKWGVWSGIFSGAFLAFYAFIGFEDMVNVAEEVKDPQRNLPTAFIIVMITSTLLYVLVAVTIILALPLDQLARSAAPLALVMEHQGYSPLLISGISLIALINGGLVNMIMAARIMYGMANQKTAPAFLAKVNHKTQTPIIATGITIGITLVFALWLPIEMLAKITSAVLLCVFIMVNLSLIIIKLRGEQQPGSVCYSIGFPIVGAVLSALFLGIQLMNAW